MWDSEAHCHRIYIYILYSTPKNQWETIPCELESFVDNPKRDVLIDKISELSIY